MELNVAQELAVLQRMTPAPEARARPAATPVAAQGRLHRGRAPADAGDRDQPAFIGAREHLATAAVHAT